MTVAEERVCELLTALAAEGHILSWTSEVSRTISYGRKEPVDWHLSFSIMLPESTYVVHRWGES